MICAERKIRAIQEYLTRPGVAYMIYHTEAVQSWRTGNPRPEKSIWNRNRHQRSYNLYWCSSPWASEQRTQSRALEWPQWWAYADRRRQAICRPLERLCRGFARADTVHIYLPRACPPRRCHWGGIPPTCYLIWMSHSHLWATFIFWAGSAWLERANVCQRPFW